MNELNIPALFFPLIATKQEIICCLFSLFHPVLHQTVKFQFCLGLNPLMCVSLEGLNLFLLFSLFSFLSLRVLSGRNGTLCVKKRQ